MSSKKDEMAQYQKQIKEMGQQIEKHQEKSKRAMQELAKPGQVKLEMRTRRIMKGHFGKIYALHWRHDAQNNNNLVSASQDGKLIIWNAFTTNKLNAIPLRSSWVMTCGYSPSGRFIACGGLDNLCSIYNVSENSPERPIYELSQHEGYLSCARFIGDEEVLTSSGDSTCILWDIEQRVPKAVFSDHKGDVMSLDVQPKSHNLFVSGSCDGFAKVWDYRAGKSCVGTYTGHESDINSVKFFPDGNAFVSASDDSTIRLYDVRAYAQVNHFHNNRIVCGITSVDFSKTGRFIFGGYDDYNCYVWDTQTGGNITMLSGHDNRISCLGVSPDGKAVCTGSWDMLLKIWA